MSCATTALPGHFFQAQYRKKPGMFYQEYLKIADIDSTAPSAVCGMALLCRFMAPGPLTDSAAF
jgi:hypothetical protein